jgi:thiol-disulfide isomerase/thioredoxin
MTLSFRMELQRRSVDAGRGQLVLINFWASWCGPCEAEVSLLQRLTQRRKVRVLGVFRDLNPDYAEKAPSKAQATYPDIGDADANYMSTFAGLIPVNAIPSSVLVRNGRALASALRVRRHTLDEIRQTESDAAKAYFALWNTHALPAFASRELVRIPQPWLQPASRKSPLTRGSSPRAAADSVNAILNYAYALGEAVTTHACLVVGLDPELGLMHADKRHRDSLSLDILETLRPTIESDILRLLEGRRFRRIDFVETPTGQCKLTETVTQPLAALIEAWATQVAPVVEWVAHELAAAAPGQIQPRTPLTRQRRLDARTSQHQPAPQTAAEVTDAHPDVS